MHFINISVLNICPWRLLDDIPVFTMLILSVPPLESLSCVKKKKYGVVYYLTNIRSLSAGRFFFFFSVCILASCAKPVSKQIVTAAYLYIALGQVGKVVARV